MSNPTPCLCAGRRISVEKPWFIGDQATVQKEAASPREPSFEWREVEGELKKTRLNQTHRDLSGRMVPFAGWEMPVVYTSIYEEHLATRQAAGLFDVSHMGVYEVKGADAASFLDSICANDCGGLAARRKFIQPVPDARCGCDRRYARLSPRLG